MARLKNDPISKPDLLDYLESYSDFSFELSVLKMLREHHIDCEHGGHYVDPVTNRSREFDIRAAKTILNQRIRMSVECKNIRENFPILISCVPRHDDEAYHEIAMVSEPERDPHFALRPVNYMHTPRARVLRLQRSYTLYPVGQPVGKSTVQVGRSFDGSITANDSELYEKWGQCVSSLEDLVQRVYWDGGKNDPENLYLAAVFPIVVIPNQRLWVVEYNDNGARTSEPRQSDRCSCFIGKEYIMGGKLASAELAVSHLEIMTFDGLRKFVSEYLATADGMMKVFPGEGLKEAFQASLSR